MTSIRLYIILPLGIVHLMGLARSLTKRGDIIAPISPSSPHKHVTSRCGPPYVFYLKRHLVHIGEAISLNLVSWE